jgi:hypothetical protein
MPFSVCLSLQLNSSFVRVCVCVCLCVRARRNPILSTDSQRAGDIGRGKYSFKRLWVQNRLRQKLQRFVMLSGASYYMDMVNAVLSIVTCALFVGMTYTSPDRAAATYIEWLDKAISLYFLFDYVLRLVLADFPLQKAREMMMIIDISTTLPVFVTVFVNMANYGSTPPPSPPPHSHPLTFIRTTPCRSPLIHTTQR